MNKADNDRIYELCTQIAAEQDRTKFLKLVEELNLLLNTGHKPEDKKPGS
jgi:hypothetical protein